MLGPKKVDIVTRHAAVGTGDLVSIEYWRLQARLSATDTALRTLTPKRHRSPPSGCWKTSATVTRPWRQCTAHRSTITYGNSSGANSHCTVRARARGSPTLASSVANNTTDCA